MKASECALNSTRSPCVRSGRYSRAPGPTIPPPVESRSRLRNRALFSIFFHGCANFLLAARFRAQPPRNTIRDPRINLSPNINLTALFPNAFIGLSRRVRRADLRRRVLCSLFVGSSCTRCALSPLLSVHLSIVFHREIPPRYFGAVVRGCVQKLYLDISRRAGGGGGGGATATKCLPAATPPFCELRVDYEGNTSRIHKEPVGTLFSAIFRAFNMNR